MQLEIGLPSIFMNSIIGLSSISSLLVSLTYYVGTFLINSFLSTVFNTTDIKISGLILP